MVIQGWGICRKKRNLSIYTSASYRFFYTTLQNHEFELEI